MTILQYKPLDVFAKPEGSKLEELLRYRTALENLRAGVFSDDTRDTCIEGLTKLIELQQGKLWEHSYNVM